MQTLLLNITIQSSPQKVWDILWNEETYPIWTKPFSEGLFIKGKLRKGERVQFLDQNEDGMLSFVEDMVPEELMVFKHLGVILKGKEQPQDEESREWMGALETYKISKNQEGVMLEVTADMDEKHIDSMSGVFASALAAVKKLAEQ